MSARDRRADVPVRLIAALALLPLLLAAPTGCGAVGAGQTAAVTASTGAAGSGQTLPTTDAAGATAPASTQFTLSSPAVVDGRVLTEFACEEKVNGVEESIPLSWANVPSTAKSLAVVMYHYPDPADHTKVSSYLLLWGIDPSVTEIPRGAADNGAWYMGANKDGVDVSYTSPCSKGAGTHEYTIVVYALSETPPSLPRQSIVDVTYDVLMTAIDTVTTVGTATLTFVNVTP